MTKILFVDDEANVLAGLRRMLRSQRGNWNMQFANGGQAALDLLSDETFDVVVTDMRMPEVDGAELLNQVADQHPHTIRLVLSGQSEHEKILRAIGPAHQFMSKPCDPDLLINTIRRACGLHSHLQQESLKALTSKVKTLPSLPEIYKKLVKELASDDASIDRVADLIESDLGMSVKVLQLVNSSFFGLPQNVTCPRHAVLLLGLDIIRPLALIANAFAQFEDPKIEGFKLEELMEHSVAVAVAARQIAESEGGEEHIVNDAYLAGMFHDIGKLILATSLSDEYRDVIKTAQDAELPLWKAEQEVFGSTHAEVGAHLLGLWGLPNPIVEAVAFHHNPLLAQVDEITPMTCVYAANVLLHARKPSDTESAPVEWDETYLEATGLSTKAKEWAEILEQEMPV